MTGTGEPFATVRVRAADGTVIATVTVGADGSFTTPLSPPQANGRHCRSTRRIAAAICRPRRR